MLFIDEKRFGRLHRNVRAMIWGRDRVDGWCKINNSTAGGRPRHPLLIGSTQGHPMKYATLALLGIGLAIGSSIAQGQAPKAKDTPELKTVEQKFAYAYGHNIGRDLKRAPLALDPEILAKGIKDGLAGMPGFSEKEIQEIQMAFQKILSKRSKPPLTRPTPARSPRRT